MGKKYDMILAAEEAFARQVALGVIVTTPQSVWHYLIPFMFVLDFLRRNATIRHYTKHFMFPRKLAIDAARDILEGEERAKRLSEIDPVLEAWLNNLNLYSLAIHKKQKEVVHLVVEHYLKLLKAGGESYSALVRSGYDNRQSYEAYLSGIAKAEEELDRAIIEKLGESEKLRVKILAERRQVKRLNEKKVDQIYQEII